MKEISKATVEGDKMFSESLYFYPKKITSGVYKNECFTAASITLMTQSLIPTLIYGKKLSTVTLKVSYFYIFNLLSFLRVALLFQNLLQALLFQIF